MAPDLYFQEKREKSNYITTFVVLPIWNLFKRKTINSLFVLLIFGVCLFYTVSARGWETRNI